MQDTLDYKKLKFSALPAEYFRMTNERHQLLFETNYEQGT